VSIQCSHVAERQDAHNKRHVGKHAKHQQKGTFVFLNVSHVLVSEEDESKEGNEGPEIDKEDGAEAVFALLVVRIPSVVASAADEKDDERNNHRKKGTDVPHERKWVAFHVVCPLLCGIRCFLHSETVSL